jgi:hypothetical protein
MAKIIPLQFPRSRLPRRLLTDGWWLETPPVPDPARRRVPAWRYSSDRSPSSLQPVKGNPDHDDCD